MTSAHDLADVTSRLASTYRRTDPAGWSVDECEQMLHASEIVRYELDGLADRIRAVNNTPRPGPVKPMPTPPPANPPKGK